MKLRSKRATVCSGGPPFCFTLPADCVGDDQQRMAYGDSESRITDFRFTISGIRGHRGTAKPVRAAMSSRILAAGSRAWWWIAKFGTEHLTAAAARIERRRAKNVI